MKERPILFNSEMVKAILDGRKTQTRRVIKNITIANGKYWYKSRPLDNYPCFHMLSPYGKIGDKLWVREKHQFTTGDMAPTLEEELLKRLKKPDVMYYASDNPRYRDKDKWRPSIHMPRWASRITLEITDVKVERVRDISNEDAIREGWKQRKNVLPDPYMWFSELWDSINRKRGYGWVNNPWIWVIEFKTT